MVMYENKAISQGQKIKNSVQMLLIIAICVVAFPIITNTWTGIHDLDLKTPHYFALFIFLLSIIVIYWLLVKEEMRSSKLNSWPLVITRTFVFIMFMFVFIVLGLLCLDLVSFFINPSLKIFDEDPNAIALYSSLQTKDFLFDLYKGTLAILVLSVSFYVASTRHKTLLHAEKQFEFAQEQFQDTQIQNLYEDIETRFQEGVKLFGSDKESARLGGIFVLWDIVKDAVKALPYLDNEHIYYYEYEHKGIKKIAPYRLKEPDNTIDLIKQNQLKEQYIKVNKASNTEQSAYKKSFSLHEQILSLLCGHIRTQTNDEIYLKQYYPSLYKVKYSKQFKEVFGEKIPFIIEDEKPSNEIQTLLDLLIKIPNAMFDSKTIYPTDKYRIPNHALDFQLNFSDAILVGANCTAGHFEDADCTKTNFQYADCSSAYFHYAYCANAFFDNAYCESTHFKSAQCTTTRFIKANCSNANFEQANCSDARFEKAICIKTHFETAHCINTHFEGATLLDTSFSPALIKSTIFDGINADLGEKGMLIHPSDHKSLSIILIDGQHKMFVTPDNCADLAQKLSCPSLTMKFPWRISITEVKHFLAVGVLTKRHGQTDTKKTKKQLENFLVTYEKSENSKTLFFSSLTDAEKILALYYLNDFDSELSVDTNN